MLFSLAKAVIRLVDPLRTAAWRVIMNHNEHRPADVARFCMETLNRGGMSVRVVPSNAPRQETPDTEFLN